MKGIHPGMSRADYDRSPGVNWSTLKHLGKSPRHYEHHLLEPDEDTDSRKLGRAVHLAALEPERFAHAVALWDGGRRYGKEWNAFKAANAGKELLTEDEHKDCLAIQRAVRNDPTARAYLAGGMGEVSMFWRYEAAGVGGLENIALDCKGRIDFVASVGAHAIVDLKTTRDASPSGFGREVWRYRYDAQAAFYVDGYRLATGKELPYVIVAVESGAPHVVQVYRLPDAVLDVGREHCRNLLERLSYCRKTASWPSYFEGESDIELPKWATNYSSDDEDVTGLGLVINQ